MKRDELEELMLLKCLYYPKQYIDPMQSLSELMAFVTWVAHTILKCVWKKSIDTLGLLPYFGYCE